MTSETAPSAEPDDGHDHWYACVRCGVDNGINAARSQLATGDVLVTINVGGLNYRVPAGGEAERYFREMAATEPAESELRAMWGDR